MNCDKMMLCGEWKKVLEEKNVIGFYDYTVILTYLSATFAVIGMTLATSDHIGMAIMCLIFAGICDAFDGKVARRKKNRTDYQKSFGIQIDSLCDLISFGVFPVVICHFLGMTGGINDVIKVGYVLAAVIRLGYYNVMEEESMRKTEHSRGYFQGLPVTSISMILPTIYLIYHVVMGKEFGYGLSVVMVLVMVLFVLDIKIKKPNPKLVAATATVGLCIAGYIIHRFGI